jgi:hypothetical protein
VIKGWDVALASMKQGEAAVIRARADFAYGSEGIVDRGILPHATLNFHIRVVGVEAPSLFNAAGSAPGQLQLPAPSDGTAEAAEDEVTTIVVGGQPVRMDKLGPMIINTDGTMSRITNWREMTDKEQKMTLRLIGKRNQQRMKAQEEQ